MNSLANDVGAQLMILLWYISGNGGKDYSWTTRRDMIENALNSLYTKLKGHPDIIQNMIDIAIAMYKDHPYEEKVIKFFTDLKAIYEDGPIGITDLVS